ncbi:CDP-diacylglycerol diphosphatase [Erwiniaceae bacterium BAC15a-03b]|uniref:CDP-diacylglycerol pyrophosphatase n=1 Tax=Winslowiella arboricola TaxID=2978220 RepID=A0A9J6PE23_9GAMM|nr:CDP-diacylglycerol diphosphatase [Winslowiella arboricola]MCU5773559.1 CDP-diacylglycerol diphosphatase [Winslowiella arboricola]MCU5776529.1 CDP-diacylglycerol diphosphatase [Winslowiella arboricola]
MQQGRNRAVTVIVLVIALLVAGLAIAALSLQKNADALWQTISEKCVPGQQQSGNPAPCENVDMAQGYVTMKDRNGPLQYLLMPVARISGIENPLLLNPRTPNFFFQSWRERHLLADKRGAPVADSAISLAINSQYGRTQNQLHIHISCLRADVRQQLDQLAPSLGEHWQSATLLKHPYLLRTLTVEQLAQQSAFIRLADEVPDTHAGMGKYGLALAALPDGRLVLMAIERNWLKLNRGSAEEIQDHSCKILGKAA